jgi:hypothetical protein
MSETRKRRGLQRRIDKIDAENIDYPTPSLAWMGRTHQWGTRVKPGNKGLTLSSLNVGHYGEIPEFWEDQTRMPRGSVAGPGGVPPIGYSVRAKHELWADCAGDLYEEAIQRRWAPTTDVPWATIEPLPEVVERAMCQLCTELCQHANVEIETITSWQQELSYGYHEVKMFLATETFDAARHFEVFRKRALCNGGGLGVESQGRVNRMILENRGGWTEAMAVLQLLRGTLTHTIYRHGMSFAHNDAEAIIFGKCLEDKSRHLAYGLDHLKYAINHQSDQALILEQVLGIGERHLVRELRDPPFRESLAIIFGGGIEGARTHGMARYQHLMGDFVRQYLDWSD